MTRCFNTKKTGIFNKKKYYKNFYLELLKLFNEFILPLFIFNLFLKRFLGGIKLFSLGRGQNGTSPSF